MLIFVQKYALEADFFISVFSYIVFDMPAKI